MKALLVCLPENEVLGKTLSSQLNCDLGHAIIRRFPDEETYVRVESPVKNRQIILLCTLARPDEKVLPLLFLCETLRELGAAQIGLVAPYLAYLRQDRRFLEGEGVSSRYFARILSQHLGWLVTIDPHLHRYHSLSEIYTIPTQVLHASDNISNWIKSEIRNPLLLGPDSESEQWVSQVAQQTNCPYVILKKIRRSDREVEISIPDLEKWRGFTPVLIDDIISTAHTMIETVGQLKQIGLNPPVCIGVHAIFADQAYQELRNAGPERVVTCNTIPHESNAIDLSNLLINGILLVGQL